MHMQFYITIYQKGQQMDIKFNVIIQYNEPYP